MELMLRPADVDDAAPLGANVAAAFDGYREFAPPGWEPSPDVRDLTELRDRLAAPETWCLVAEDGDGPVGHASFFPASVASMPLDDPGVAHLAQLFVVPEHWGTGLATRLLAAAVTEARARDFHSMRLFTTAANARARRFYEREGFAVGGEPFMPDDGFGMELIEYRLPLV